jgi:hypothetical protein
LRKIKKGWQQDAAIARQAHAASEAEHAGECGKVEQNGRSANGYQVDGPHYEQAEGRTGNHLVGRLLHGFNLARAGANLKFGTHSSTGKRKRSKRPAQAAP